MDRYSHADRVALASTVRQLLGHCDCHIEAAYRHPKSPPKPAGCRPGPDTRRIRLGNGATYCAFEAGSGLGVSPTGQVEYCRTPPDPYGVGADTRRVAAGGAGRAPQASQLDISPWTAGSGTEAPKAPLPAGFRVCRCNGGHPSSVRFTVPMRAPGGVVARAEWRPVGQLCEAKVRIPRRAFENSMPPSGMDIERDLEPEIGAREDRACLEQLHGLGGVNEVYEYKWHSTLDDLARFVAGLNSPRPSELPLDTVFVNYGMYLTLFANDLRTPSWAKGYPFYGGQRLYQNMSVLGGIAFLHHPGIPHDGAFAISSEQGPVFVHGPSAVSCADDEVEITRRYGFVEPPRGAPGCPWGVRFGVVRDHEADNEWPGEE